MLIFALALIALVMMTGCCCLCSGSGYDSPYYYDDYYNYEGVTPNYNLPLTTDNVQNI